MNYRWKLLKAKELAATGFQRFTTMNGIQIFRKPKLFQTYGLKRLRVGEKVFNTTTLAISPDYIPHKPLFL